MDSTNAVTFQSTSYDEETTYDDIDGEPAPENTEKETLRIPADVLPLYKLARKIAVSLTKASQHEKFLSSCVLRNIVPKGLQPNVTAQIPNNNWTFHLRWEETQLNCGKKLRDLLNTYYADRRLELTSKLDEVYTEINTKCPQEIQDLIKTLITKLQTEVANNKDKKGNKKAADTRNTQRKQWTQQQSATSQPRS